MRASDPLRRRFLATLLAGAALAPLAVLRPRRAQAADLPLLDPSSAAAKKVNYVPDASQAKATAKGNSCAGCGLYQGAYGSKQGACPLFHGRDVLAGGWCSSWEPQM
ncbi:MAG TPA: high-potential iron-sulfur protein [Steroidobacteraceae bacterium]|nr:high-potential iron-sulfur protein [Steroidobacteraceae bacterium]